MVSIKSNIQSATNISSRSKCQKYVYVRAIILSTFLCTYFSHSNGVYIFVADCTSDVSRIWRIWIEGHFNIHKVRRPQECLSTTNTHVHYCSTVTSRKYPILELCVYLVSLENTSAYKMWQFCFYLKWCISLLCVSIATHNIYNFKLLYQCSVL